MLAKSLILGMETKSIGPEVAGNTLSRVSRDHRLGAGQVLTFPRHS